MKLHHVDRPRVARELGHHLASSQIPELGQGGLEVRTGPGSSAARSPSTPAPPALDVQATFRSRQAWDTRARSGGRRGPGPSALGRPQAPAPGPGQARSYLHCVVIGGRRQPLPVGAEPEAPHGLAVSLRRGQSPELTSLVHPVLDQQARQSQTAVCQRCPRGTPPTQACFPVLQDALGNPDFRSDSLGSDVSYASFWS